METQVTQLIGQLGFPMFVAVWMLIKQSKDTQALTEAIKNLNTAIEKMQCREGDSNG